jgi:predicted AAA+ superfamily ATPase
MGSVYKLDKKEAEKISSILSHLDIRSKRVLVDLDQMTLESKDDDKYEVKDLLEMSGKISEKRADELIQHIKESREEWGHE